MDPVDPLVIELIESWPTIPALVMGPTLDVLASNRIAVALSPYFAVGTNLARVTFFEARAADGSARADRLSEIVVDLLREAAGRDLETRNLRELVGELAAQSDAFSKVWSEAVSPDDVMTFPIAHPVIGDIVVGFHHLVLPGAPSHTLVVAHVEPGSVSEERMFALVAKLAAEDADGS